MIMDTITVSELTLTADRETKMQSIKTTDMYMQNSQVMHADPLYLQSK